MMLLYEPTKCSAHGNHNRFLFARPIFTNRQLAAELNIPFKTAGQYIEKLIQAGILRETTGYARNRIFRADEILRAVEGLV